MMRTPLTLLALTLPFAVLVPSSSFAGDDGKPDPNADGKPADAAATAPPGGAPESYWDLLLEKYDKNKDGVISKTEYTRGEGAFKRLDRNDDGVLTTADMPRPPAGPGGVGPRGPRAWSGGGPIA